MRYYTRAVIAITAAMVVGVGAGTAQAQVALVDENFQTPSYGNGTYNPVFTGWTWGAVNYLRSVTASGTADLPVDVAGNLANQAISIENITTLNYTNISYTWARGEAYILTLSASPMEWGGTADRYIVASLLQTNGAALWTSGNVLMPKYRTAVPAFGRSPWTAAQTFTFVAESDAFTAGTEGQPLRLQITQGGARGIYVDNVTLKAIASNDSTPPSPDPMTFASPPDGSCGKVAMTATAATDPYPVEYKFDNVTQGTTSGWQDSPTWIESGLPDGATYQYTVTARDKSTNQNTTAPSAPASATTAADSSVMLNEDFQTPTYGNNQVEPVFPGWILASGVKSQPVAHGDGVPGDATNQVINYEQTTHWAIYDLCRHWQRGEAYTLTLNASPQSWNGSLDRYIVPSLCQQDGAVLWSRSTLMPKYNNFGGQPWTAAQTFTYTILSDAFTAGAPGQPLRLHIASAGNRGIYIDNVRLEKLAVAPADTTPPAPDPMAWGEIMPTPVGCGGVTMRAATAVDMSYGVEYLFENTTKGTSSGWQSGTTWTESGLDPATTYSYRVKARDTSPNQNETDWSDPKSATTADPANPVLLSEEFQTPLYPGGTAAPYFVGWNLTGPLRTARGGGDGAPGDSTNQLIQFEWSGIGYRAEYDVCHNWARRMVYTLALNAAPQAWSGTSQRYFVADILQQDGTLLWTSGSVAIPILSPANKYQGQPWPPELTFSFAVPSFYFTAGSAGQPLRVRIYTAGSRGVYVDNVRVTVEPEGAVILVR